MTQATGFVKLCENNSNSVLPVLEPISATAHTAAVCTAVSTSGGIQSALPQTEASDVGHSMSFEAAPSTHIITAVWRMLNSFFITFKPHFVGRTEGTRPAAHGIEIAF